MKKLYIILLIILLIGINSKAQNATYVYTFHHSLKEKNGTGTDLVMDTSCSPTYSFASFPTQASKVVLPFGKGCGLTFDDNTTNLLSSGDYSIELYFKLDTINGYKKLIDYDNRSSDNGFYVRGGKFSLYPGYNTNDTLVEAGQYQYVVLTRAASTKEMHIYYNGNHTGMKVDNNDNYLYGSHKKLIFFQDDKNTNGEQSSGAVAFIKISNYTMDSNAVKNNYTNINNTLSVANTKGTNVTIFPNPVLKYLTITAEKESLILVHDMAGRCLYRYTATGNQTRINMGNYPAGVYILNVYKKKGEYKSFRILKH